jgi:hypothetical protein
MNRTHTARPAGNYDGLVLRFSSKSGKTPATLHASTCNVAKAENPRRGIQIIRYWVADAVADLNERGYQVKRCACCSRLAK